MIATRSGLGIIAIGAGSGVTFFVNIARIPGEPGIPPGGLPYALGVVLILLGVLLIWVSQKHICREPLFTDTWRQIKTGHDLPLSCLVLVYFTVFQYVPFVLGSIAFMVLGMRILGLKRWPKVFAIAVSSSLTLYILFRYGFLVILP